MGIIDNFSRLLKSNLNDLINKAEDPAKTIAQNIEEMEEELKKARQDVISSLATEKRLDKKSKDFLEEAASWERRAMLALEHGDDELAREALRRKKKAEGEAAEADKLRAQQATYVTELRSSIEAMEKKLEEYKARKNTMASQVGRARSAAGNTELGGSNTGALGRLKEIQDRMDNMDAEVEAAGVIEDGKKADLEARFRRLERGEGPGGAASMEDELAALKAKLKPR